MNPPYGISCGTMPMIFVYRLFPRPRSVICFLSFTAFHADLRCRSCSADSALNLSREARMLGRKLRAFSRRTATAFFRIRMNRSCVLEQISRKETSCGICSLPGPRKQPVTAPARSPKKSTTPGVINIRNSTRGISGRKSHRI